MRDPKRIKPFLEEIGKTWEEKCSDWRFGQVLSNTLGEMCAKHGDLFFWEDDKFLEYFKEFFDEENI